MAEEGRPPTLPSALEQVCVGLLEGQRVLLEPTNLHFNYTLGPGDTSELLSPVRRRRRQVATEVGEEEASSPFQQLGILEEDMPRVVRVMVRQARVERSSEAAMDEEEAAAVLQLRRPVLLGTCQGYEARVRAPEGGGPTSAPAFTEPLRLMYTGSRAEVQLDLVDLQPRSQHGSGWRTVATTTLVLDEDAGQEAGAVHWCTLPLAGVGGLSSLVTGTMEVGVAWSLRLLCVSIQRVQHLVRGGEAQDLRPFVEVTVGGETALTDEFVGLPDADLEEHDVVFNVHEPEPTILLTLRNRGRLEDELLGTAELVMEQETFGEWLTVKDADGRAVCEVRVGVAWVDTLEGLDVTQGAEEHKSAAVDTPARARARAAQEQQHHRRMSFDAAYERLRQQVESPVVGAVLAKSLSFEVSEVDVRLLDLDLPLLRGVLATIPGGPVPSVVSVVPPLPMACSTINLSGSGEGGGAVPSGREGKQHLYQLFKQHDTDRDGRLTREQLGSWLQAVANNLSLTRTEVEGQIQRLLSRLRLGDDVVSWYDLTAGLEGAALDYQQSDIVADARCMDYASPEVVQTLFPQWPSNGVVLGGYLGKLQPGESLGAFWEAYEGELGLARGEVPEQGILALQLKLVRMLKNYLVAREVWRLVVVPAMLELPVVSSSLTAHAAMSFTHRLPLIFVGFVCNSAGERLGPQWLRAVRVPRVGGRLGLLGRVGQDHLAAARLGVAAPPRHPDGQSRPQGRRPATAEPAPGERGRAARVPGREAPEGAQVAAAGPLLGHGAAGQVLGDAAPRLQQGRASGPRGAGRQRGQAARLRHVLRAGGAARPQAGPAAPGAVSCRGVWAPLALARAKLRHADRCCLAAPPRLPVPRSEGGRRGGASGGRGGEGAGAAETELRC
jgi:hypothetical protein